MRMKTMTDEAAAGLPPKRTFWTETFGNTICVYSQVLGLPPVEAALFMAGVLCNLSGHTAALADGVSHHGILGFSLTVVGSGDHRYQRLLDRLVGPVKSIQVHLREGALRLNRSVVDGHTFGPVNGLAGLQGQPRSELYEQFLKMWDASAQVMKRGATVPHVWEERDPMIYFGNYGEVEMALQSRLPDTHHRPTILHLTNDLTRLEEVLGEVFDQRLWVVDTAGGFFRSTFSKGAAAGNRSLLQLASLLAGKDIEVSRLHPEQGYGSLQHAQVRVMTCSCESRLADMLSIEMASARPSLLQEMLLVAPQWKPIGVLDDPRWFAEAQAVYRAALLEVINHRICRNGPVPKLGSENMTNIWKAESAFINTLDSSAADLGSHTKVLSCLVRQLVWAFGLLRREGEPFWCLKAAEVVAHHAAAAHLGQLRACRQLVSSSEAQRLEERIVRNLENKGPSTRREIQRSLFGCKQRELAGALEALISKGALAFDDHSERFAINVQRATKAGEGLGAP